MVVDILKSKSRIPIKMPSQSSKVDGRYSPEMGVSWSDKSDQTFLKPYTGLVKDPVSGANSAPEEAISNGRLDALGTVVSDTQSQENVSLSDTVQKGWVNSNTGKLDDQGHTEARPTQSPRIPVLTGATPRELIQNLIGTTDPATGQYKSLTDAIKEDIVKTDTTVVKHPVTGELLRIQEAINAGILDEKSGAYTNPETDEVMSFEEAIRLGLVVTADKPLPLTEAVGQGLYEPATGLFLDPISKKKVSLLEALSGIIDPSTCSIRDPSTDEILTLEQAIEKGVIDPQKGQFFPGELSDGIPLDQAMALGYIMGWMARNITVGEAKEESKNQSWFGRGAFGQG